MCALVLLNLLNSLRKRDKMLGQPRIFFSPTRLINSIKHEHSCKILYLKKKPKISGSSAATKFGAKLLIFYSVYKGEKHERIRKKTFETLKNKEFVCLFFIFYVP